MSQVRLGRHEAERGELPRLCLRCGAPASHRWRASFAWHPVWAWVPLLLEFCAWLNIGLLLFPRISVYGPFCDRHRAHWRSRQMITSVVVALLGLAAIVAVLVMVYLGRPSQRWPVAIVWLSLSVLLLAWILVLHALAVKPVEITSTSVTLKGVADSFVAAAAQGRAGNSVDLFPPEEPDGTTLTAVRLGRYEAEQDQLPAVCLRCGAAAQCRMPKKCFWFPAWVSALIFAGFIPYVILHRVLGKELMLLAPMCKRHQFHWLWRQSVIVVGLVLLVGLFVAALALPRRSVDMDVIGTGFGMGLLGWGLLSLFIQATAIHAQEITDHSITLVGVCTGFVAAVHRQHQDSLPQVIPVSDPGSEQFFDPQA